MQGNQETAKPSVSKTKQREIDATVILLADRGLASPEFMQRYTPQQVIAACEAWAKRVGIIARGAAVVGIASGSRYPGLFDRLLP